MYILDRRNQTRIILQDRIRRREQVEGYLQGGEGRISIHSALSTVETGEGGGKEEPHRRRIFKRIAHLPKNKKAI